MIKKPRASSTHALVICNGEVLSKSKIAPLLREQPFIICADGGANKARLLGIRPHAIIGDLDSISSRTRKHFSRVETIHIADQESTDLEKALDFLLKLLIPSATVVGATGGRPDHSLANLSILKKYHRRIRLLYSDPFCDIRIIDSKTAFEAVVGSVISLMPLDRCEGIQTIGLKYPLENESLELGEREGTSNVVISSPVQITVKKGCLLLFVVKNK
jgi:thiamine pyrophosphokinase